ncbi:MAG: HAD-IC family P-type ATPase, partial [Proteobacteria bacterium]|nr:HAD-IC family P-type ATPase [Pseudomonadota bacterium]
MAPAATDSADASLWSADAQDIARRLGASPEGLTSSEAAERLRTFGRNALEDRASTGPLRLLWRQFESPLVLILVFGAGVAFALRDWTEATIILAIVLGSTALGFAQEFHASRAIAALRQRMALKSRVMRDGVVRETPAAEIVPGDTVLLSAGNLVPADGRILEAQDFLVSEASLTGEPFPVEKRPGNVGASAPLAARSNFAFAGSSVRSGAARVLVTTTGGNTAFGAVAARLREREPETAFVRGLRRFGYLLLRVTVLLVLFVLIINQLLGRPFLESLLFSVALAVGMSPELLPAIVSVTLSAGARAMAEEGVLVRRLDAIENLGGIDLICTDKTGTLTEGAVALQDALDVDGAPSDRVLALAYVNAAFETGIENPLDQAIKVACEARQQSLAGWRKLDEIPYDFQRKRLTIVAETASDAPVIITKGAFNETLAICTEVEISGAPAPLDEARRANLSERYRAFGSSGLRALALATRACSKQADYSKDDERDMRLVGFLTFVDPLKADARATIDALKTAGVSVKIITGDNRYVAAHVASGLGLDVDAVSTGEAVSAAKGGALIPLAERTQLFAEVDPQQKERIVKALQQNGHVVGFIGDGVNDAPALYAADVGISV